MTTSKGKTNPYVDARGLPRSRHSLVEFAETPIVRKLTDKILKSIPETGSFESFDELAARRDETGVVRRKR